MLLTKRPNVSMATMTCWGAWPPYHRYIFWLCLCSRINHTRRTTSAVTLTQNILYLFFKRNVEQNLSILEESQMNMLSLNTLHQSQRQLKTSLGFQLYMGNRWTETFRL